jgi:hypothetical protein
MYIRIYTYKYIHIFLYKPIHIHINMYEYEHVLPSSTSLKYKKNVKIRGPHGLWISE